jgi:hypothetical protein
MTASKLPPALALSLLFACSSAGTSSIPGGDPMRIDPSPTSAPSCEDVCAKFSSCGAPDGCMAACPSMPAATKLCVLSHACTDLAACSDPAPPNGPGMMRMPSGPTDPTGTVSCATPTIVASGLQCPAHDAAGNTCVSASLDDATADKPGAVCTYQGQLTCGSAGCEATCKDSEKFAPEDTSATAACRLRCRTIADCGGGRYTACRKPTGEGATAATLCF